MEFKVVDVIAGIVVGLVSALSGLWAGKRDGRDGKKAAQAIPTMAEKQDETLRAVNNVLEALGRVEERVDEVVQDHSSLKVEVAQHRNELHELRGRVGTLEKLATTVTGEDRGRATEREPQHGREPGPPPATGGD